MSRAAVHAARAAAGINNLAGKFNHIVFGENKDRYVNICGMKSKIGRFWYGEQYVFNEDYCKNLLETSSSKPKVLDRLLGPMSKFTILYGVMDTALKSTGTLFSVSKKDARRGAEEIVKSVTGLDNKETAETVRAMYIMIKDIQKRVKYISQSLPVSGSGSPPSASHGGGGGGGAAADDGGGAADDGGRAEDGGD